MIPHASTEKETPPHKVYCIVSTYQQVGKQDGHQYYEDDPDNNRGSNVRDVLCLVPILYTHNKTCIHVTEVLNKWFIEFSLTSIVFQEVNKKGYCFCRNLKQSSFHKFHSILAYLMEEIIKLKFPCGHCHCLEDGTTWCDERRDQILQHMEVKQKHYCTG